MWKLLQNSSNLGSHLRCFVLNNNCAFQQRKFHYSKVYFKHIYKETVKKPATKFNFKISTCTKIGLALTTGGILQVSLLNTTAFCKAKTSRITTYKTFSDKDQHFDWNKFWLYLKPHIWYFIAAIAGALAVAILNIQIPQLVGGVINVIARYTENRDGKAFIDEMRAPVVKLIGMYIGQSVCTFFYIYMLSNLGEKICYEMRTDLFTSILKQDISFFDEQRTGEIINRLTADIQDFKSSFKQTVSGGLRAVAQIVGCSVSLVMISPHMTFITLLCIPTVVAVGTLFGAFLRITSRKAQEQVEKTTAVADEAVSNIRTVRAFAMEDQEQELFNTEAELAMILNEHLGFGIGWFQAGTNIFLNGMVLITLYMGGYLLSTDKLTPGQLMAYLMASQTIQRSLGQLSLLFGSVVRGLAAGSRIFEYMNLQPSMSLKGGHTISELDLKGDIEFKNVTFAYPSRCQQCILKNFNLKIPAGKTLALVGASGNGKSTVVALIERFYDVNCGKITLDGYDIKTLDPSWFRKRVLGLISQEPVLFGTSVMENIRYGRPDATDEEVKEAAMLANAHDFISSFPQGYDTMVGERGATLSGGQKQRVAIARALLKNPAVLLLDEATSALDTESEKIVQHALERAKKGRTVVIVAHRLSTIQNADIIVVLNKGVIVEMGTHEELTEKHGYYWSLTYQQQEVPAA